jgi:hypothetical protein
VKRHEVTQGLYKASRAIYDRKAAELGSAYNQPRPMRSSPGSGSQALWVLAAALPLLATP